MDQVNKFEIEYVCKPGYHNLCNVAMLTGIPIDELIEYYGRNNLWYTRTYIKVFQELCFNCDSRFVKFRPDTDKPCIMRMSKVGIDENRWYSAIYYDGFVYASSFGKVDFETWITKHMDGKFRITSMLRVWI